MRSKLYWLPLLLALCTAIAFSTSYIVAVIRKDVNPIWPYISDTGTKQPESCIFGQLLNVSAALALATMYVRYKLVQAFNSYDRGLGRLNKIGIAFGILSAVGVSIVANFQETSVIQAHLVGACMAFGLGVVYCFFHSAITRKMYPTYNGQGIWVIRLIISVVGLISMVLTMTFAGVATYQSGGINYKTQWNETEPGYDAHLCSTISEWVIGLSFLAFFLTYVKDFQKITMRLVPELLVSHLDEVPIVFSNSGTPTERTGLLA